MPDKSNKNVQMIATDWNEVREVLRKPQARRGATAEPRERALRDYFGEQKFRLMRDFAARGEQTRNELGNVVLLPGIMGSHLSVVEKNGDEDHVWINFWRIFKGDLKRLRLKPDGKTNVNGETVRASGVIGWYYGLALEALQATPFPYDWRVNLGDSADLLADFIEKNFAGEQVHFVAHSMGGLVVREFVRRHRDLWNEVKGRLVMLGTPNAGSFAAVQGLMGKNQVAKYLSYADITHDPAELARIINTFYGLYQLCPAKTELAQIYEKPFWEKFTDVLFDDYLSKIPQFHQDLSDAAWTIDRDRMSYIAGIGFETASAMKALDNGGGFDFEITLEGDGTVPHKLGLLKGVTTYFTNEAAHSDLLNDRTVLQSVKDILQFGKTDRLTTTPTIAARSRAVRATAAIETDLRQTQAIARQLDENKNPPAAAVFEAEKKLLRAILGGNLDAEFPASFLDEELEEETRVRFKVQPVLGDIKAVASPVIAAGQYQNLPPQGATLEIDKEIGYWISYAHQNEIIGAALGQLSLIPLDGKRLNSAVKSLIVSGMGEYNRFSRDDLRYLTMNIALAAVTLGHDRLAMVLFGTSEARISIDLAVRSILAGVGDALKRQQNADDINFTLVLVEHNPTRFSQIKEALGEIKEKNSVKGVEIAIPGAKPKPAKLIKNGKTNLAPADFYVLGDEERAVTRITVERDAGDFTLSAVTANAANPKREICLQNYVVTEIVENLLAAQNFREQNEYGRLLHNFLMPEEFQSLIDTNRSLVLMLNREAAAIPWEMLAYRGVSGTSNFGIDLSVTRQFTSLAAPAAPAVAPPLNRKFKALIIADPAEDPALRLNGARVEGEELNNFFIELKKELEGKIDFRFQTRIGFEQCKIGEILRLIFNEEFDLIHFAGHGVYEPPKINPDGSVDAKERAKSGWVFGRKPSGELIILSAQEIFRLRRVPRLVFANACFSSAIGAEEFFGKMPLRVADEQIAGLAEAFFLRGIENYIGAGWQVDDAYAVEFAKTFYEQTLKQAATLGEAVSRAREAISERNAAFPNNTWGAYQHYGNANTPLVWRGK